VAPRPALKCKQATILHTANKQQSETKTGHKFQMTTVSKKPIVPRSQYWRGIVDQVGYYASEIHVN